MEMPDNPFGEVIVFVDKADCIKGIYYILPLKLEENNRILCG
jgi:hypothetical protein